MSKKIEIPLEEKVIKSVPIRLPDKCVYCGAPKQETIPKKLKRKYSYTTKFSNERQQGEYEMHPIDIPYCEQHFNKIRVVESKLDKISNILEYPLIALSALVSLLLLYKPIYTWFMSGPKAEFVPEVGPLGSGFTTVMIILSGPTVVLILVFSQIFIKIYDKILNPFYALEVKAFDDLTFDFQNEKIAEEFLAMNREIGAREWNLKQSFKEGLANLKKVAKESKDELRK